MSSRAFDIPKPDTGLAEWTSKIKAMQRQVDADEEAEQKRLEDEIAASRRARLRRSRSFRRDADGSDLSQGQEQLGPVKGNGEVDSGALGVINQMTSPNLSTAGKPEPISLAAFMGGRATGPRLNRHAPQQDAHDPTQFDKPDLRAPHPVFGRGGVAMPGMAAKKATPPEKFDPDVVERYRPTSYLSNNQGVRQKSVENLQKAPSEPVRQGHHTSTATSTKNYLSNRVDSLSPQKTGNRERTISTPAVTKPSGGLQPGSSSFNPTEPRERTISTPGSAVHKAPAVTSTYPRYGSRSPLSDYQRAMTPSQDSSTSPTSMVPTTSNMVSTTPKPSTPRTTIIASPASYPPQKTPIITPSLARPIQPENRVPPISPQIPTTASPSPAFLKPSVQKEPTPSISRLQGRGFVQNMVRASSNLESPSPAASSSSEKSTPTSGRKSSVLDRWQPNVGPSPMSSPSPPFSMRRSATYDPKPSVQQSPQRSPSPTKPASTSTVDDSFIAHAPRPYVELAEREHAPLLGSANTVFMVEPNEVTNSRSKLDNVDELGIKRDASPMPRFEHNPMPIASVPSTKPLNHPTKGRARKPKRHSGTRDSSRIKEETVVGSRYRASAEPTALTRGPSHGFVGRNEDSIPADFMDSAVSSASKIQHLAGAWANTGPISMKFIKAKEKSTEIRSESTSNTSVTRRALPGMTKSNEYSPRFQSQGGTPSDYQHLHPTMQQSTDKFSTRAFAEVGVEKPPSPTIPLSPGRHSRIPSTGNRATAMIVAQVLTDRPTALDISQNYSGETKPLSPHLSTASALLARNTITSSQPELSRKPTYDKYSALPPLKEEATPTPTPSGTLSRSANVNKEDIQGYDDSLNQTISDSTQSSGQFDLSIPVVNVDALLQLHNASPPQSSDLRTIAVDVMSIIGTTATPLSQNTDTFYDTELLVIVHRSKSISSGLVSTIVWVWMGKDSHMGEREERKINEVAKRYGTSAIFVSQYTEPTQLVRVLGDQLKIRQGTRTHWSADNTAMYIIRSFGGVIFIDQYDLNVKNLCSGFSYCITIMDTVYLWHGRGSSAQERQTALWYAQSIMNEGVSPIELSEGENDDDEMFWMILGDEAYANAHYWRWRRKSPAADPSVWRVDSNLASQPITPIHSILEEKALHNSIYIIDCIWESFVLVGREARGERRSIKLALDVALQMSERNASSRPFTPTVHVLVLPSRLPLDLRLNLRGLDEAYLNDGAIPDHMNLLSSKEALSHLRKHSWERIALKDHDMLPLGVTVSDAT